MQQRPMGLTLLAAYMAVTTVLNLVLLATLVAEDRELTVLTNSANLASAVYVLVGGLIYVILANGYWQMKPWAWPAGLAIHAISLLIIGFQMAAGAKFGDVSTGLIVHGVAILYLRRQEIQQVFGR